MVGILSNAAAQIYAMILANCSERAQNRNENKSLQEEQLTVDEHQLRRDLSSGI
jgi:hypothetical protein